MNKEQKVTSQQLSKELQKVAKEKGFELPESEYCWCKNFFLTKWKLKETKDALWNECAEDDEEFRRYKAYDTSELCELMTVTIDICRKPFVRYSIDKALTEKEMIDSEVYFNIKNIQDNILAEAMGKMLVYLISNKLI